jgi:hypothetical protein
MVVDRYMLGRHSCRQAQKADEEGDCGWVVEVHCEEPSGAEAGVVAVDLILWWGPSLILFLLATTCLLSYVSSIYSIVHACNVPSSLSMEQIREPINFAAYVVRRPADVRYHRGLQHRSISDECKQCQYV